MICKYCKRDIDVIGQEDVSAIPGHPICEDCGTDTEHPLRDEIEDIIEKEYRR